MEMTMGEAFVLDKASILVRLGDDEEIFAMMVQMYVDDIDSNCEALSAALKSGDATILRREAHTVKGLLATFSDDVGAAVAAALEKQAAQGGVTDQAGAVASLQQRMREVAAVLSAG
jgi:HPt (histidine-containing phosphotransfer) domain-containing protein